jgi:hypothetical protein
MTPTTQTWLKVASCASTSALTERGAMGRESIVSPRMTTFRLSMPGCHGWASCKWGRPNKTSSFTGTTVIQGIRSTITTWR